MELYFTPSPLPWPVRRLRYPAEQMLLTLFPSERPEYPAEPPRGEGAVFSLREDALELSAQLRRGGREARGSSPLPADALERSPEQVYHILQHALKMAFYQAGCSLLGAEPAWGALTGVRPVKLPSQFLRAGDSPEAARARLAREYRVSPQRAALAVRCAQASLRCADELEPGQFALYVGIPFCPSRCTYCSFVSADVGRSMPLVEPYLSALHEEIAFFGAQLRGSGLSVSSFYMGGGTPTTLEAEQLDALLHQLKHCLPLERCAEFTVEAGRPDTVTRDKLAVLRAHGVARISINPQTMEDAVLERIGRRHTARDVRRAYALSREAGFPCVNMDLIAGLPGDSPEGFARTLEAVLDMDPENLTVHTLALKKGSRLMERSGPGSPDSGGVEAMLALCLERLPERDYAPYYLYRQKYMASSLENVGWSKPGFESRYNIMMMEELQSTAALGAGGVSKCVGGGAVRRVSNPKYPQDYLNALPRVLEHKQTVARWLLETRGTGTAP